MTKREFLEELKEVLSEQLPQNQVAEHVSYYMNYIEEQKQNGSSEEEVLNMLGDPRLIARTILDTAPNSRENQNYFYEETTPIMGMSISSRIVSRASALAVLQATTMAFTSCVCKKRTICLEYRKMVSFDLLP